MNNPEYILVDEVGILVTSVKNALVLPVLNYQYGNIDELNETIAQWSKTDGFTSLNFPLVYLEQPFLERRGKSAVYFGLIDQVRLFIIASANKTDKAKDRMANNFKPVIYPIYRQIMKQLVISPVFLTENDPGLIDHTYMDAYKQAMLNDTVDCSVVTLNGLKLNNNLNCMPLGMLNS